MTAFQKAVKYAAATLAVLLIVAIFGGIVSAVGGLLGRSPATGETTVYAVSDTVRSLNVHIRAAEFSLVTGQTFSVESNLKHLKVTEQDGVLQITETEKAIQNYTDAKLVLTVPADTVFERADLTTGAGKVTVDTLSADTLRLDFGAGAVRIGALFATSCAELDGGAGELTVSDGALHNLTGDMGVGRVDIRAALSGNCRLDLGVGESNLTVLGARRAYSLDMDKGVGRLTVDGVEVSAVKEETGGENRLTVDGGIGAVYVNFEEADTP